MDLPFKPDYSEKVAVVTGGAGVLCREFCKALAMCGAKVAVLNRTLSRAEAVVEEIKAMGGEAAAFAVNVTDRESVSAAHAAVLAKYGRCSILINGAGGNDPAATTDDEIGNPVHPGTKRVLAAHDIACVGKTARRVKRE